MEPPGTSWEVRCFQWKNRVFHGDRKAITLRLSADSGRDCLQGLRVGAGVHFLTANTQTHLMIHTYQMHLTQINRERQSCYDSNIKAFTCFMIPDTV